MIAPKDVCQPEQLARLLESQLDIDDERQVTRHLDQCINCRAELQRMAGTVRLWEETRDVLSASSELSQTFDKSANSESHSHAAGWIASLLDPSDDPELLGMLDGRPVQAILGQGGMGVVLRVWDDQLHRPLAIKLLSPMLASAGVARQRFFREAQAVASVVHPNIVPIYAVASDGPLPYIVMPLIGGGSLQQRIEQHGSLPLLEVLSVGLQIAEGLSAAHQQGLVHRDIKPANILLDEGGHRVLLSDFGLARALDDASVTASGMVAGTPHFMSPEQARGETVDERSDLYSLGAMLYTMATGHPPVRGDSPLAVLRKVTDDRPRAVHEVNEVMPTWMDRVIARFLAKPRDQRIGTAEEAAQLLRGCLAHLRAPARNPLPLELTPGHRVWRKAWTTVSLVLVSLGSLALVGWLGAATVAWIGPPSVAKMAPARELVPNLAPPTSPIYPLALPRVTFEHDPLDDQIQSLKMSLQQLQLSLERP